MWRDGQKKRVFVYRFLSTGTIEEKVYQRQLSKEGLQNVVNSESKGGSAPMSAEELRDLFTLRGHTMSDTYDSMCCPSSEDDSQTENALPAADAHLRAQVSCRSSNYVPLRQIAGTTEHQSAFSSLRLCIWLEAGFGRYKKSILHYFVTHVWTVSLYLRPPFISCKGSRSPPGVSLERQEV